MLTKQQELFVKGLIEGKSQRQAYLEAFPQSRRWKEKTVDEKASRLLKDGAGGKVKARLEELQAKIAKRIEKKVLVDAEYVITGLKEVAEMCKKGKPLTKKQGKKTVPVLDKDGNPLAVPVDSLGATKALELMGKSIKMFTDKVEVDAGGTLAELLRSRRTKVSSAQKCKPSEE